MEVERLMKDQLTVQERIKYPRVEIGLTLIGKVYKAVADID